MLPTGPLDDSAVSDGKAFMANCTFPEIFLENETFS
jgi:hypothetical protein